MTESPLQAEKFLQAAWEYLEPFKGTYLYDAMVRDFMEKTGRVDAGYRQWLDRMLRFLVQNYALTGNCVLDFGCGTGELTVHIRSLGYEAYGLDVHEKHLKLARILAEENGFSPEMFILSASERLPFPDKSVDVVTMFSVLEHLDDSTLKKLLPEFRRICRGVIYVLVPNRLKSIDDHTGLEGVPVMPRWLAAAYVKMRGEKHRYFISRSQSWDVHYRTLGRIASIFRRYGFALAFPPDDLIYPPLEKSPPVTHIGWSVRIRSKGIFIGMRLPRETLMRWGWPRQAFYPYLNLIFIP